MNWRCGCVISEKAVEEVRSDVCYKCGGPFNKDNLVMLNPPDHILQIYEAKLKEERLKKKAARASSWFLHLLAPIYNSCPVCMKLKSIFRI